MVPGIQQALNCIKVAAGLPAVTEAGPWGSGVYHHGWPERPVAISVPGATLARAGTCVGLPGARTGKPHQVPQAADTCPRTGGDSVACWCCIYFWLH